MDYKDFNFESEFRVLDIDKLNIILYDLNSNITIMVNNDLDYSKNILNEIEKLEKGNKITANISSIEGEEIRGKFTKVSKVNDTKMYEKEIPTTDYMNNILEEHINSTNDITIAEMHSDEGYLGLVGINRKNINLNPPLIEMLISRHNKNKCSPPYDIFTVEVESKSGEKYNIIYCFQDNNNELLNKFKKY